MELSCRVIPSGYPASTSEQLVAAFHDKIGFLTAPEWDELADIVAVAGGGSSVNDKLYDELLSKLALLPDHETVERKLGREIADTFIECLEDVEDLLPAEAAVGGTRFSKREVTEVVHLMAILTHGDKERVAIEFQKHKTRRRDAGDDRRRIRKVDELNIWFPHPQRRDEWLSDPKTKDRAEYFLELVDNVRTRMKGQLQQVPRKRLNAKSASDMERNMQSLSLYLMTT